MAETNLNKPVDNDQEFERINEEGKQYFVNKGNTNKLRYINLDYDKAISSFEKAIKLKSDNSQIYSNIARWYLVAKKYNECKSFI